MSCLHFGNLDRDNEYCVNACSSYELCLETTYSIPPDEPEKAKKFDTGKLRYDLIPPEVLEALAEVLTYGAQKYGPNNWQQLDDFENRYTAADLRHYAASRKGEKLDPESGLSHKKHRLCNLAFLVWKETQDEKLSNV